MAIEGLFLIPSSAMTQKLINHAIKVVPDGHILWTHVTSHLFLLEFMTKLLKNINIA